jgi:hypothetical protein
VTAGEYQGGQSGAARLVTAGGAAFEQIFEMNEQGQAQSVLDAGDPRRVATVLFATVQGIATLINDLARIHGSFVNPAPAHAAVARQG